jgi:cytochrome c oxidase assembly protein subunit 15
LTLESRLSARSNTFRLSSPAFGLVAITWVLLVFGASVRVNGAGLACPDWPLCFGEVIPTIDLGVFFEFGHRVYAGGVSLLFAALGAVAAWRWKRGTLSARPLVVWGVGFVALMVQVVLGGLTVLELLAEWTVASHLLVGNTFCLMVLLFGLTLRAEEDGWPALSEVTWAQRAAAVVVALLVPTQIVLGGFVSSSYAGLVCPSWPTCAGDTWFPTFAGLVGLQVSHRLVAYVLAAAVLVAFATAANHRDLRLPAGVLLLATIAQVALGVANVFMRLPVEVTLAHTGMAALIALSTTWLVWRAFRAPVRAPVGFSHPLNAGSIGSAKEA